MRRLGLDYQRTADAHAGAGWLLLVAGLSAALGLVVWLQQVRADKEYFDARFELLGDASARAGARTVDKAGERALQEETRRAAQVVRQLQFPWGSLLAAVETAHSKEITLVALQPDLQKDVVRITAETDGSTAMLDYVRRLAAGGTLTDVHLLSHQTQAASKPLRFVVEATLAP